jgi:hypothetical protein
MRALTVQQPWAWAIVHGGKDVENRTQEWSYRGPLLIHAGLAKPEKHNLASAAHRAAHGSEVPTNLVFGAVIGVVDLVDVHPEWRALGSDPMPCCSSPWAQFAQEPAKRVVHLELEDPRPIAKPIPARGQLGLWSPTADLLDQVWEQVPA